VPGYGDRLWILPVRGSVVGLSSEFSPVWLSGTNLPIARPLMAAEDGEESLWIGYSKGIYRVKNGNVTQMESREGVPSGRLEGLIMDCRGKIWLIKKNKVSVFQDEQFHQLASLPAGTPRASAARTNGIWITVDLRLF